MYQTLTQALVQARRDDIRRHTRRHQIRAADLRRRTSRRRFRMA